MIKQIDQKNKENELGLQNICATYGNRSVLEQVTLNIARGEIVVVLGPNGAGKSSILKVAAGLMLATKGSIWIKGKEVTKLAFYQRAGLGLSYFVQGGKVFSSLTVKENISLGALTVPQEIREEYISITLDFFPNLKKNLSKKARYLSGGDKQMLALAILIARRPSLLLLDEPSIGVSPLFLEDLFQIISNINSNWQTSILIVEQNVRQALMIAHRTYVIVNGKIVFETADPDTLLRTNQLEKLYFDV
jgi:branched-chain amino acid transport system ATP-binding protein